MGTTHGSNGVCQFGSDAIGELTAWTLTESIDTVDDGATGDTWKTHLTGRKEWSGSITVRMDKDDTAQAAMTVGASGTLSFYPEGDGSGASYKTGTATITEVGERLDFDGVVEQSFNITGNGALSVATVGA